LASRVDPAATVDPEIQAKILNVLGRKQSLLFRAYGQKNQLVVDGHHRARLGMAILLDLFLSEGGVSRNPPNDKITNPTNN
jgi:hypothetical protein